MKINNVQAIIWDFDGTLLDSFHVNEDILREITSETGREMPSLETRLKNYHGSLKDTLINTLSLSEDETDTVLESFLKKQDKLYQTEINSHLYKDALGLARVASEKDITQLVVTNRDHEDRGAASPRSIIANTELGKYVDEIICGDETQYRKPDSRVLGEWTISNSINPGDLLIIGDQFVDAQFASNLGARALIVKRSINTPYLDNNDSKDVTIVESLDKVELC